MFTELHIYYIVVIFTTALQDQSVLSLMTGLTAQREGRWAIKGQNGPLLASSYSQVRYQIYTAVIGLGTGSGSSNVKRYAATIILIASSGTWHCTENIR